jgi:predicted RNase H-like HicB family nuclease
MKTRRYAMIIEGGEPGSNYSAYLPDLPGCIAVGDTLEELRTNMAGAIKLHLASMYKDGDDIPDGTSLVEYVEIPDEPAAWNRGVKWVVPPKSVSTRR